MSVLIKGMKMPVSCLDCPCNFNSFICKATLKPIYADINKDENDINISRPKTCPLIKVPTPHGRLIDADVLKGDTTIRFFGTARVTDIDKQPTILESETEE